jgi:hypothetical protein
VWNTQGVRRRRELFHLLALALQPPDRLAGVSLSAADVDALVAMAVDHRVVGQLVPAFETAGLPVPAAVLAARQAATVRHLQTLHGLQRAITALDRAGVAALVVKGPVLATSWYGDPASRQYHDLDLLVAPSGFSAAVDALVETGFAEQNRNWTGYRSLGMGEVPLHDGTVSIDLHWHLVTFAVDRASFVFPTDRLLRERVPVELGSVATHRLSDADTLAHTVLHAGLAGARLLIHQRDVHVVASAVGSDAAVRRMDDVGMTRLASATLNRVARTLGPLPVPLDAVRAPGWKRLNATLDRAWATALPQARNPYPSAVLSAGRSTSLATARALGRQLGRAGGRHLGLRTFTSPGGPLDTDLDAGGAGERRRFLADIERGRFGQ